MTDFIEFATLIEQLNGRLSVFIKCVARGAGRPLNNAQLLIVLRIPDREVTINEVILSGSYDGTNATYNIDRLVEAGILTKRQDDADKRARRVALTATGAAIRDELRTAIAQRSSDITVAAETIAALRRLDSALAVARTR